jgi:PAS domain S-box-containing protein
LPTTDQNEFDIGHRSPSGGSEEPRVETVAGRLPGNVISPRSVWLVVLLVLGVSIVMGGVDLVLGPREIGSGLFATVNITTEILRTICAISVFGVVWLTRRFRLDMRNLIIAMAFLAVGVFTIFRLLTIPGMPSMGGSQENINHTLYLSAILRVTVGVGMLLSAYPAGETKASSNQTQMLFMATIVFSALTVALVLIPQSPLPNIQNEASAPAPGFVYLEIVSMALCFLAAFAYARLAAKERDSRYLLASVGLILFAQAGFAFLESHIIEDAVFLLGRITALAGFFLVFLAVMKRSLFYPYAKLEIERTALLDTRKEADRKTEEITILAKDLMEREATEAALRESERTLFKFLIDLPVGIVVSDPSGRYIFSNTKADRIMGKSIDPSIPQTETASYYQAYLAGTNELYPLDRIPMTRALKGEAAYVDDIEFHRDNSKVRVEIWGAPVIDQDDKLIYAIAAFQDITERKKSEGLIKDLNKSLEMQALRLAEVNTELEAFSYSVSHDLRSPLRSIDGFSTILTEHYSDALDDKGKDYLVRIRTNCQRMGQLIDDMLKLSRITRDEITWDKVELSEMVKEILSDLKKTEPDRKIKLVVQEGVVVRGDGRLYRILMTNLLENAWKFCQKTPHPVIEFGVMPINGEQVFFVRDNGAGFDMNQTDKLFVPFQRLHSSVEFAGTGIGLAISQRIVHRHGGRIWGEGESGKGATFYFTAGLREPRSDKLS